MIYVESKQMSLLYFYHIKACKIENIGKSIG